MIEYIVIIDVFGMYVKKYYFIDFMSPNDEKLIKIDVF